MKHNDLVADPAKLDGVSNIQFKPVACAAIVVLVIDHVLDNQPQFIARVVLFVLRVIDLVSVVHPVGAILKIAGSCTLIGRIRFSSFIVEGFCHRLIAREVLKFNLFFVPPKDNYNAQNQKLVWVGGGQPIAFQVEAHGLGESPSFESFGVILVPWLGMTRFQFPGLTALASGV
jgi:hypothetical protein